MRTVKYQGRTYAATEKVYLAIEHHAWALRILAAPEVIYPNGKSSHEAAGIVLESAENKLIGGTVVTLG
jgi:hypothetical protein